MTVQTQVAEEAVPGQVSGLVLGTTKRVLEYYASAKDFSPMLKSSLETVESRVPEQWAGRITSASEPVLAQLDTRFDDLSAKVTKAVADVNERVVVPVSKRVAEVNEQVSTRVVAPVSDAVTKAVADVNERVVAPVSKRVAKVNEQVTARVAEVNQQVSERVVVPVSDLVTKTVADVNTRVIAPVQELRAVGWKDLRGEMSKKAMLRLEQGFEGVKEYSATRGKEMIHMDLIAYSRDILDNARATATPLLVPVTEKVVKAVEDVKAAAEYVKSSLAAGSAQKQEELAVLREQLQVKLAAAKEAARALGAQGTALVQQKYALLPDMEAMLTSRLPANLHGSVKVILDAPRLFAGRASEVCSKAEFDGEKRVLDNIASLLQAVREVVFAPPVAEVAVVSE